MKTYVHAFERKPISFVATILYVYNWSFVYLHTRKDSMDVPPSLLHYCYILSSPLGGHFEFIFLSSLQGVQTTVLGPELQACWTGNHLPTWVALG